MTKRCEQPLGGEVVEVMGPDFFKVRSQAEIYEKLARDWQARALQLEACLIEVRRVAGSKLTDAQARKDTAAAIGKLCTFAGAEEGK
jgi:hypothetical protein